MLAPRICTPWSEGRKKFFRDLCDEANGRWDLAALITIDDGEKSELPIRATELTSKRAWQHLTQIRFGLQAAIRHFKPDLVCHLPFGEFAGLRGIANSWCIWSVERICRRNRVACCTLMYALTSQADSRVHRYVLRHAYFNQYSAAARKVRFGVRLPAADARFRSASVTGEKNILFMAGVAEENSERLDHVLDTRGLRFLLRSGAQLRSRGYRLIVAIPLLRNAALLEKLKSDSDNHWEPDAIEYCAELAKPEIYLRTHVFAFPYANEELQFVPTSIVEAMHYHVPVILPRLKFLRQFYEPSAKALVYDAGNTESFAAQLRCIESPDERARICADASQYVASEYDIRHSVTDIENLFQHGSAS